MFCTRQARREQPSGALAAGFLRSLASEVVHDSGRLRPFPLKSESRQSSTAIAGLEEWTPRPKPQQHCQQTSSHFAPRQLQYSLKTFCTNKQANACCAASWTKLLQNPFYKIDSQLLPGDTTNGIDRTLYLRALWIIGTNSFKGPFQCWAPALLSLLSVGTESVDAVRSIFHGCFLLRPLPLWGKSRKAIDFLISSWSDTKHCSGSKEKQWWSQWTSCSLVFQC